MMDQESERVTCHLTTLKGPPTREQVPGRNPLVSVNSIVVSILVYGHFVLQKDRSSLFLSQTGIGFTPVIVSIS